MQDIFLPEPWQTALPNLQGKISDVIGGLGKSLMNPVQDLVLRAFKLAPSDVKVVIVGQDPYPNPDHACGLAFSVPKGVKKLPLTLINIRKELVSDLGLRISETGDLSVWGGSRCNAFESKLNDGSRPKFGPYFQRLGICYK